MFVLLKTQKLDGRNRNNIKPGIEVFIVLKENQRSGTMTKGVVKDILTKNSYHPYGIKVRLISGEVGRIKKIIA